MKQASLLLMLVSLKMVTSLPQFWPVKDEDLTTYISYDNEAIETIICHEALSPASIASSHSGEHIKHFGCSSLHWCGEYSHKNQYFDNNKDLPCRITNYALQTGLASDFIVILTNSLRWNAFEESVLIPSEMMAFHTVMNGVSFTYGTSLRSCSKSTVRW